MTNDYEYMSYF